MKKITILAVVTALLLLAIYIFSSTGVNIPIQKNTPSKTTTSVSSPQGDIATH